MPIEFDITNFTLPARIDNLFEKAILFAQAGKHNSLIDVCQEIEKYFNFPAPDENVKHAEIPGGMYTNMLAQLKQLEVRRNFCLECLRLFLQFDWRLAVHR